MNEKIEETIIAICDWIQSELESEVHYEGSNPVSEMVKALAELVSAR